MKLQKLAGATSEIWQVFVRDSSSTIGAGLTGLTNLSGSLTAYYHRDTDTTATAITLASMTVGTFTSSGFKEIDATNMPGWYQFCPPNAALASGAKSCAIHLKGATNMAPLPIEVQLTAVNPDSAASFITGVNGIAQTGDSFARLGASAGASVSADIASVKSDTGTILTDVNTGAGAIYTRIGAPAGASIAADIAAVEANAVGIKVKTDSLAFTASNQVDANILSLNGDGTAAVNLAKADRAVCRGTCTVGGTTTSIPTSAFAPAPNSVGQFIGRTVLFDADTTTQALRGQASNVTASTNSATPTLTVSAMTAAPASGDTFSIV